MITQIPFPEKGSRTYQLAGSVSKTSVLGQFVFNPKDFIQLDQITRGTAYRFLSISFSANCPEVEFRNAFVPVGDFTEPMARLVYLPENVTITPKGFPVRNFFQEIGIHAYFTPSSNLQTLAISFAGTFDGDKIPGITPLVLTYSVTMQELSMESYKKALAEGKF